jgi:hypothetical protein
MMTMGKRNFMVGSGLNGELTGEKCENRREV